MIIVSTTNQGSIFLNMTKLVGFISLAEKFPVKKAAKIIGPDFHNPAISKLQGKLFLPEPNSDYTNFYGTFKLESVPGAVELEISNVLFRGGILKGETSIIGLVVYCGQDTKLQLNTRPLQKKFSKLEKAINIFVLYILLALFVVVVFSVIGFYFIGVDNTAQSNVIEPFITFTLLYNNIIPISLFVVIDLIRLAQSYLFSRQFKDITFNTEAVNENLGQIEYLIVDKTGNLAENNLKLKMCIIGDTKYEEIQENYDCESIAIDTNHFLESTTRLTVNGSMSKNFKNLATTLDNDSLNSLLPQFVRCMALCHDLYRHHNEYLGSHEEAALVEAANEFGYSLQMPEKDLYELSTNNLSKAYFRVVASRPYNREKKRSRILLEEGGGAGVLYVKGSSEAMIPLLNISESEILNIIQSVENMNKKGLRTMILGYKCIAKDDILEIKSKIQRIKKSLLNPESRIEAMFKDIEKNLKYLGITGLSEEMLPCTAKTISKLQEAGIKI